MDVNNENKDEFLCKLLECGGKCLDNEALAFHKKLSIE